MAKANGYIGKQVGNYRITARIASGSFGTVYRAQHTILTRTVAIKMMHVTHLNSEKERDGFLNGRSGAYTWTCMLDEHRAVVNSPYRCGWGYAAVLSSNHWARTPSGCASLHNPSSFAWRSSSIPNRLR